MAKAPAGKHASSRAKTADKNTKATRAAKQEIHKAQDAAEELASSVRSSAKHFGRQVGQTATHQATVAVIEMQDARDKAQEQVREHPLLAVSVATGVGLLLGMLSRR